MAYKESTFESGSLRDVLKRGTKEIHSVADSLFTDELVKKKISVKTYRTFLSQLYFLYSTLEEELDNNKDHIVVGPVHFPDELNRTAKIEEDLSYFYGVAWQDDITCLQSAKKYAARLREIGQDKPELLIAHAYVRYMGDVSGGQILKKIIRRMYKLPVDGRGVQFYEFDNIDSIPTFKEFYSGRMNSLEFDDAGKAAILEEAITAFRLNIGIFREIVSLAESKPGGYMITDDSSVSNMKGCPVVHDAKSRNANNRANAQCPFAKLQKAKKNAAVFAVTSASTVAVLFAMMMSYCPWVHKSELF